MLNHALVLALLIKVSEYLDDKMMLLHDPDELNK